MSHIFVLGILYRIIKHSININILGSIHKCCKKFLTMFVLKKLKKIWSDFLKLSPVLEYLIIKFLNIYILDKVSEIKVLTEKCAESYLAPGGAYFFKSHFDPHVLELSPWCFVIILLLSCHLSCFSNRVLLISWKKTIWQHIKYYYRSLVLSLIC